jgi:hypothetical protein
MPTIRLTEWTKSKQIETKWYASKNKTCTMVSLLISHTLCIIHLRMNHLESTNSLLLHMEGKNKIGWKPEDLLLKDLQEDMTLNLLQIVLITKMWLMSMRRLCIIPNLSQRISSHNSPSQFICSHHQNPLEFNSNKFIIERHLNQLMFSLLSIFNSLKSSKSQFTLLLLNFLHLIKT